MAQDPWADSSEIKASFYPPNLRAIEGMYFEDVEKVVMADGIALYGVPRTAIAEALIRADSAAKRREILGSRWKAISADCRVAVLACESDAVAPYVPCAVAALDALDGGDTAAAQALVGSLIDSLLTAYLAWTGPTSHRTAKARGRPPPMKSSPSVSSSRSRLCGWRISSSGWRTATAFPRLSAANARHRDLVARRHAAMSRPRRRGRPRTVRSIRALVLRLVAENPS